MLSYTESRRISILLNQRFLQQLGNGKEIGLQLFERSAGSSHVELTAAGSIFREYAELAVKNIDTGLRLAYETQSEINSEIRIGTIYAMQGYFGQWRCRRLPNSRKNPPKIVIEQALFN